MPSRSSSEATSPTPAWSATTPVRPKRWWPIAIAEEGCAPHLSHGRARRIFGFLDEIALDGAGGCVLHPLLRARARIEQVALILGTGTAFEIWSPHVALDGDDPDLADLAAFHLNLKRAA